MDKPEILAEQLRGRTRQRISRELWASHPRKLERVYSFLLAEKYWFGAEPSDPDANAAYLGTIRSWTRRHDRLKKRGVYVELSKTGDVMAPTDVSEESTLHDVIAHVHQIGWQLRLGEHIEGKDQDRREAGLAPMPDEQLTRITDTAQEVSPEVRQVHADIIESMRQGVPGEPLNNAHYRFNPPGADRSPLRNVGRPGYESETRELVRMMNELDEQDEDQ